MNTKPHKPSFQEPAALEALAQRTDPIERMHAAHETAALLVDTGHTNPELTQRLVSAVEEVGMPLLAEIWADRPAVTLPGALYRLYALREWITLHPETVAKEYSAGMAAVKPDQVLDTQLHPAQPEQVRDAADAILHGAFTGDFAFALRQAGALCHIVAKGRQNLTPGAADLPKLKQFGKEFMDCANAWDDGVLQ